MQVEEPEAEPERPPTTRSRRESRSWADLKIAGVGLLGALIGGLFTFLATYISVHAQSNLSRTEFQRTQRQSAYSTFLSDHHSLADAELAFWVLLPVPAITLSPPPTSTTQTAYANAEAAENKMNAAEQTLRNDLDTIQLVVGSETVYLQAYRVRRSRRADQNAQLVIW